MKVQLLGGVQKAAKFRARIVPPWVEVLLNRSGLMTVADGILGLDAED